MFIELYMNRNITLKIGPDISELVVMFAMHAAMVTGRVDLWGCCQENAPSPVPCHCQRVYMNG